MLTIQITQEAATASEMADTLREIARLIDEGYTSGYQPTFELDGESEADKVQLAKEAFLSSLENIEELEFFSGFDLLKDLDDLDNDLYEETETWMQEAFLQHPAVKYKMEKMVEQAEINFRENNDDPDMDFGEWLNAEMDSNFGQWRIWVSGNYHIQLTPELLYEYDVI